MTCTVSNRQTAVAVVTTGDDESWFWGVSPIRFACREHIATAEPEVIATAEPDVDGPRPCDATWS